MVAFADTDEDEGAMTKAEIIESVYERVGGFSKKEASDLVEAIFETMKETLASGHKIKISGFGNFVVRDKKERPGLNPRTRERIVLSPRRVVRFRPSPVLKALINEDKPADDAAPGASPTGGASGSST
jgi:integration host factor subunit alpha